MDTLIAPSISRQDEKHNSLSRTSLAHKVFVVFAACLLLAACIDVDDFGTYWGKGTVDPLLKGAWRNDKGECVKFVAGKNNYRFLADKSEEMSRTLHIGQHTFLMMKKTDKPGGTMLRYTVANDTFTTFGLNSNKKEEFIKQHSDPNIVVTDTVTIKKLDTQAIALLQKISDDPDYWETVSTYKRSDCNPSGEK